MAEALRRIGRGRYSTRDGRYVIESDVPGLGEWDEPRPTEWFVYDVGNIEDNTGQVVEGNYGPPDALTDGFPTLRAARDYVEKLVSPSHYPRFATYCPNPGECARDYHPQLADDDTCECCGGPAR
jgi:hypothetical protein